MGLPFETKEELSLFYYLALMRNNTGGKNICQSHPWLEIFHIYLKAWEMCFVTEVKTTRCLFFHLSSDDFYTKSHPGLWENGESEGPDSAGRRYNSQLFRRAFCYRRPVRGLCHLVHTATGSEAGLIKFQGNRSWEVLACSRPQGWLQIRNCKTRTVIQVFLISAPILIATALEDLSREWFGNTYK